MKSKLEVHQLRGGVLCALIVASLILIQSTQAGDSPKVELKKLRLQLDDAFNQRHLDAYVAHCSDDMTMSGPVWRTTSKQVLEASLRSLTTNRPDVTWGHDVERVDVLEDVAFETGHWREDWTKPDGRTHMGGPYSALWKLEKSVWVLRAEVFSPMECIGSPYCD